MTKHDHDAAEAAINAARPEPEFIEVAVDPKGMRQIIEGLRALPNVSELPVIKAIAELDRIAAMFERAAKRRQEMAEELINALRTAIREGKATPTQGCDCERCNAIRSIIATDEQKNSS